VRGMHDLEAAECELLDVGAAMERRQLLVGLHRLFKATIAFVWHDSGWLFKSAGGFMYRTVRARSFAAAKCYHDMPAGCW
jgi:hypothetical protein